MWDDIETLLVELGDRVLLCLLEEGVYVLVVIPQYTLDGLSGKNG